MTLRSYIWSLRLFTITSLCAFLGVIFFIGPIDVGMVAYGLFYVTTFLWITGCSILVLTHMRERFMQDAILSKDLSVTLRQGILIGLLICILLALQQFRILTWWDALLSIAAILLIELYFITRTQQ